MTTLSPTGARILANQTNGIVTGHPAAIARLLSDRLVRRDPGDGTLRITPAGRRALAAWTSEHGKAPSPVRSFSVLPKLPRTQHEAVVTAARRADQLVPGRGDRAYWRGEAWFNGRTLAAVHAAGYADRRPTLFQGRRMTWDEHGGSLFLTPAGRQYARQRGNVNVHRRRIVLIACGQEKAPARNVNEYGGDIDEFGNPVYGYPAGELYIGQYHRSLRRAADALTDQSLIRILSALHGLVTLEHPLHPYDVSIGDERAITVEKMRGHTERLGLHDADVIFLGGRAYAELLRSSVPHLLTPLTGGMGEHRSQCHAASESAVLREDWWRQAAELFNEHHVPEAG